MEEYLTDEEDEELDGLLMPRSPRHKAPRRSGRRRSYRQFGLFLALVALVVLALIFNGNIKPYQGSIGDKVPPTVPPSASPRPTPAKRPTTKHDNNQKSQKNNKPTKAPQDDETQTTDECLTRPSHPNLIQSKPIPEYTCACSGQSADVDHQHHMFPIRDYMMDDRFVDNFRHLEFDDRGRSYTDVKNAIEPWKLKYYGNDTVTNSVIYESGVGVGLNLYMLLELLHEAHGVENVTVYGSDLRSLEAARRLTEHLPGGGRRGNLCLGHPAHLGFVPANTFDLVFSSYVTPLSNPLGLNMSMSSTDPFAEYNAICNRAYDGNPEAVALKRKAQNIQNTWFAQWFKQMMRIAKPGAPIIIEQLSTGFCDSPNDWGGVAPTFWTETATINKWNIDTATFSFAHDNVYRNRYHMFVRKKK